MFVLRAHMCHSAHLVVKRWSLVPVLSCHLVEGSVFFVSCCTVYYLLSVCFWGLCFHLPFCYKSTGITDMCSHVWLYMRSGDLNSGHQACVTAETSPLLCLQAFKSINLLRMFRTLQDIRPFVSIFRIPSLNTSNPSFLSEQLCREFTHNPAHPIRV